MPIAQTRAEATRRIQLACGAAPGPEALLRDVAGIIGTVVANDWRDWQLYDPLAMVPVSGASTEPVPWESRLAHCEIEQFGRDANPFRVLARQPVPVATLHHATNGLLATSRRYRELLAPAGIRHELRATFVHRGACWGTVTLYRAGGDDFSNPEQRWIARACSVAAAFLARCAAQQAAPSAAAPGPGVITLSDGCPPVALTQPGQGWLDLLSGGAAGQDRARAILTGAAISARAQDPARPVTVHITTPAGWTAVHAAATDPGTPATLVVQLARPSELKPLLSRAYGLTRAEETVATLAMRGMTSKETARQLQITNDTVHDHLKAIYRKTGAQGRGHLQHQLALDVWEVSSDRPNG